MTRKTHTRSDISEAYIVSTTAVDVAVGGQLVNTILRRSHNDHHFPTIPLVWSNLLFLN